MRSLRLALLVIAQIVVALIIVEVLGQAYFNNPFSAPNRYLFTSLDSFRDVGPFWTYRQNIDAKEVAIYQTVFGGFEKEYECDYHADKLGFVDNESSGNRDYDFLLLGDSFTQGQGGCPWAGTLRQHLPGASIYNAGLQGTGPANWAPIAQYLLQQGLRFRAAIVIFISDDFRRHLTNYDEKQLACLHDPTLCDGDFFYPIVSGLDLMKASAERAQGTLGFTQRATYTQSAIYFCERYLWVSCFIAEGVKHLIQPPQLPIPISEDARRGLDSLLTTFPRLLLIRVRTKDEVALKSDNVSTIAVKRFLRDRNIDWTDCTIRYDGFLTRDPHPNSNGYRQLAQCIAQILRDPQRAYIWGRDTGLHHPPRPSADRPKVRSSQAHEQPIPE